MEWSTFQEQEVKVAVPEKKIKIKGTDLSRELYNGVLNVDNAGYGAGVELFNFIFHSKSDFLLPQDEVVEISKESHSLARLIAARALPEGHESRKEVFVEEEPAITVLSKLFSSLQIQPSNLRKTTIPAWNRKPFFPYTKSLIHWDIKKSNMSVERIYLRGGGALAFKILRMDPDAERLERLRKGFDSLYKDVTGSPLDRLASFFSSDNKSKKKGPNVDEIEQSSLVKNDDLDDLLRDGMVNILEHQSITAVTRIQAVINWTGLWLAIMQYRRSCYSLGIEHPDSLVVDCCTKSSPLRRLSRRSLKECLRHIRKAVDSCEVSESSTNKQKVWSYFNSTCSSLGLFNAHSGTRHFTLKVRTLETIVLAFVEPSAEMTFETFLMDILYNTLGLVVSRESARQEDMLEENDTSMFEENENGLAEQMRAAGLLSSYSDATKMVSSKGLEL